MKRVIKEILLPAFLLFLLIVWGHGIVINYKKEPSNISRVVKIIKIYQGGFDVPDERYFCVDESGTIYEIADLKIEEILNTAYFWNQKVRIYLDPEHTNVIIAAP